MWLSGAALRGPGFHNLQELWTGLLESRDFLQDLVADEHGFHHGKVGHRESFDADFQRSELHGSSVSS